jgi:hypothetical protein
MINEKNTSRGEQGACDHAPEDPGRTERIEREKARNISTWKRDNLALQTEDKKRTDDIEEAKKKSGGPL